MQNHINLVKYATYTCILIICIMKQICTESNVKYAAS